MSFDQDPNEQANISGADLAMLIDELALTKQKLEAAEQAIRESQEQLTEVSAALAGYKETLKLSLIRGHNDRKDLEAAQLHIKELREALEKLSKVVVTQVGADYNDVIHAAYIEARDALAKQPDTRALDKALLEAEIKALDAAYKTCVPYSVEFSHMINDRKAKLAELNKV